jgi:SAM-dependent methyltransferase
MLAPKQLPAEYEQWNRTWHAPFGRTPLRWELLRYTRLDIRRRGPFGWQPNNTTREFEYPWTYHTIRRLGKGLRIVEIGGGVSGLQFVLAMEGHDVTNIDPGLAAAGKGWELDSGFHRRLCQTYRSPVRLINKTTADAGLPDEFADVVLCVSAIEHFSDSEIADAAKHVSRLLKPTGLAVFTTDLFVDVVPFTDSPRNRYGKNVDVYRLLADAGLTLVDGRPDQLYGFPEFSPNQVLRNLSTHHVGRGYPCLAQCFTARRSQ